MKALEDVVDYRIGGVNSSLYLDREIRVLDFFTGQERDGVARFPGVSIR